MEPLKINLSAIKEAVNFFDLANHFGEEGVKLSYDSITMLCPFHKEKTGSFVYNINKKTYRCFGCHKSGDCFDYVGAKLGTNRFKDSIDFLLGFTGIDRSMVPDKKLATPEYKKQLRAVKGMLTGQPRPEFELFNEADVKAMIESRGDFFKDRGFTKETLDEFGVGLDVTGKRVTVPIRDENGNLIGITGRTILPNFKDLKIPKWKHYKGSSINDNLFNINNAIKHSKENAGSIIICEGPSDSMWLHQNGFKNSVACLTNRITKQQKFILLKNFMNIYLMLDGDAGGENGKSAILEEIRGYFNIFDVEVPKGKDPDNLTKEELTEAIKNAKKI